MYWLVMGSLIMWSTTNRIHGKRSCDLLHTISVCRYTSLVPGSPPSSSINLYMWGGEPGDQVSYTHFSIISSPNRTSLFPLMGTNDEKSYLSLRYGMRTSCHWGTRSGRLKPGLEWRQKKCKVHNCTTPCTYTYHHTPHTHLVYIPLHSTCRNMVLYVWTSHCGKKP